MKGGSPSEAGGKRSSAETEDVKEGGHDGRRPGDDDSGYETGIAVGLALADGAGPRPDLDDAPDEPEHENNSEGQLKTLFELTSAAGGLSKRRDKY